MNLNGAKRTDFPTQGYIGDLWFSTDEKELYLAVSPPDDFLSGQSDPQQHKSPRLFERGNLTVLTGLGANLPTSAAIGTVLVTTDTLQAFAGAGAGVPILKFNLDVLKVLGSGLAQGGF